MLNLWVGQCCWWVLCWCGFRCNVFFCWVCSLMWHMVVWGVKRVFVFSVLCCVVFEFSFFYHNFSRSDHLVDRSCLDEFKGCCYCSWFFYFLFLLSYLCLCRFCRFCYSCCSELSWCMVFLSTWGASRLLFFWYMLRSDDCWG